MKRPFWDDGDDVCRGTWLARRTIDEQIGITAYGEPVFRCRSCGTYWEQTPKWIVAIPEERALRVIRAEAPPRAAPAAPYLVLPAHRDWPREGGRVILPDLPLSPDEPDNDYLRWVAEVLAAIADVLDAEPEATEYLLELQHARYTRDGAALHRDGYNLLVSGPLDWERARALLDPNLPEDWERDGGSGAATAIGVLSRSIPARGPNEIETVGTGFGGRRRLAARQRDVEKWRAAQPAAAGGAEA